MKAFMLADVAGKSALAERDIPRLAPKEGEVAIQVVAAGVTPTELGWYPTSHTKSGDLRAGAVPCHEFSGRIAAMGAGVTGVAEGEEIFGMNDWFADGALAEFCIARPEWIARKPGGLTHAQAASVPIGALTAWQGLFDRAKLQAGEQVLVQGGAGAVGVFAIQLARFRGAQVTATVSTRNLEFVKQVGANRAIDYTRSRFEDEIHDVDVVFDAVGGETLRRSWGVLKTNGRMVTIAADGEATQEERARNAFFIVEPNGKQLAEVGRMLDAGELRAFVDVVAPFPKAADAFTGAIARNGRGKIVVTVP